MYAAPTAKAKAAPKAGPGPRAKVLPDRITGKITDWKGKFGWISADKPVSHPDAAKHGGKIYLAQQDVDTEIEGIGSSVSFFVYADGTGLGAMNCRPATSVDLQPQKPIEKLAPLSAKGPSPAAPKNPMAESYGPNAAWMFAANAAWAAATGKGGGSDGRTPFMPGREVSGKIKDWKGTYGWVTASEPVPHPLYRGQLYVSCSDLVDRTKNNIKVGDIVVFTLYTDHQGLGAENCRAATDEEVAAGAGASLEDGGWGSQSPAAGAGGGGAWAGAGGGAWGGAGMAGAGGGAWGGAGAGGGGAWGGAGDGGGGGGAWGGTGAARATPAVVPPARPHGGPKKRLTEVEATGEVLEWEGAGGWLRCHEVFEHEAAKKNDGKVYVARTDVVGKVALSVGSLVQFHVSADRNGLLAEAVKPF